MTDRDDGYFDIYDTDDEPWAMDVAGCVVGVLILALMAFGALGGWS